MRNLAGSADHATASRQWFADLLWKAWPDARSEHELAHLAAPVLDLSPRQVKYYLRGESSAKLQTVTMVLAILGAEVTLGAFKPAQRRRR